MKKILIVITTAFVPTGGLATVMMNYYRAMNRHDLIIDFTSSNADIGILGPELEMNGSKYYCLGNRKNLLVYFYRLYKLSKGYDVIHINGNSATTTIELLAAWLANVKVRIDHNHTTMTEHRIAHYLMLPLFQKLYTIGLACSDNAGNWLFGKEKFSILRNAIDTDKYRFSTSLRENYREEWGIPPDALVIGHVGKYNAIKNHQKLLEVFKSYHMSHTNSILICVGYGPLQKGIEMFIRELGLVGKVILTGERTDVPGFLCAMDVFVFPSKYEGLGMAVIEAQASGLACIVSDRVPQDVYMSDLIRCASLEMPSEKWAEMIDQIIVKDRDKQSQRNIEVITNSGYNIKKEAKELLKLYMD